MRRALALAGLLCAVLAAPAAAREKWDTKVLAAVGPPGFPAKSLVAPDGHIYVGTYENPSGDTLPSRVLEFGTTGDLGRSWVIPGQTLSQAHGIQVVARYPDGRLVLLDHNPARALILDPRSGSDIQPFATFADVHPCAQSAPPCSKTVTDNTAQPDYAAWGPDGSLYVTDYTQGIIWRVPPEGGEAKIWLTDPALDGGMFGTADIVMLPDHRTLLISQGSSEGLVNGNPSTGRLYKVSILPDGKPGPLEQLWESGPAEAPDGITVAQSGNVYMALVGPGTNQLVEISPTGKELARFPSAKGSGENGSSVPFDEPSSVEFDRTSTRLIVTNLAYASGDTTHQVLFDIEAGEPGMPVYVPPAATPPAVKAKAKPKKKPKAKKKKKKKKRSKKRKRSSSKRH